MVEKYRKKDPARRARSRREAAERAAAREAEFVALVERLNEARLRALARVGELEREFGSMERLYGAATFAEFDLDDLRAFIGSRLEVVDAVLDRPLLFGEFERLVAWCVGVLYPDDRFSWSIGDGGNGRPVLTGCASGAVAETE